MEIITDIINEIFELYNRYGEQAYHGEPVSQTEHMLQSANLAMEQGYDDEVILAAFFHDIGHLCTAPTPQNTMGTYGIIHHEKIGADFLRAKGFPEKIAKLVENHVQAKRYLTFKYPDYLEQLSEASKKTLDLQGGPMLPEEAVIFESDPLFEVSLQLRKWDELAKKPNTPLIDLNVLRIKTLTVLGNSYSRL